MNIDLKTMTADQLITGVKLSGSTAIIKGHTTPEKWPFVIIIAIGKPGNEGAMECAQEFTQKIATKAPNLGSLP